KTKSQNVIVELEKDGKKFTVGIHFRQKRDGIEVSSIRGLFPKNTAEWLNWITQGKSLYLNKGKIQTLINQQQKNLADVDYLDLNSIAKVIQNFENPQIKEGKNAIKQHKVVFGGNSGYVGYSKSVRAVKAEQRGLRSKSQMDKEFTEKVNALIQEQNPNIRKVTLSEIKKNLDEIVADEWHHTSMYGNKTNYYSAERVADYFIENIDWIDEKKAEKKTTKDITKQLPIELKKRGFEVKIDEFMASKGVVMYDVFKDGIKTNIAVPKETTQTLNDFVKETEQRIEDVKKGKIIENAIKDIVQKNKIDKITTINVNGVNHKPSISIYNKWQFFGSISVEGDIFSVPENEIKERLEKEIQSIVEKYNLKGRGFYDYIKNYDEENNKERQHNVKFFKTSDGEAYGFTVNGKIYIDKTKAKADTPIHEYTHLWAEALKQNNPEEWKNIVDLMKKEKALWDKVKKDYPELKTDDEIADEVLAHYSGANGLKRLNEEVAKVKANSKESILEKAHVLASINNIKKALERFWKGVADWLGIHFTTAQEVADKVLSDLLNGVNPTEIVREFTAKNTKSFAEINEIKKQTQYNAEEQAIIDNAKADGTFMKAPNGKKTNLTERQWVQVRTKAFKDWFGDWELGAKAKAIRGLKAIVIIRNNFTRDDIKEKYGNIGEVTNKNDNRKVTFYKGVFGKMYKDGGLFAQIVPQLKGLFENSVLAYSETDNLVGTQRTDGTLHKEHRNISSYDNYVSKAKIDGKEYYVRFTVQNETDGRRGNHSLMVTKVSLYDNTVKVASTSAKLGERLDIDSITDAKLQQFFENARNSEENSSKVVDENGEPLVVYHGAKRGVFTVFDTDGAVGTKTEGTGSFFTADRTVADTFSSSSDLFDSDDFNETDEYGTDNERGGIYAVFLDIKNPEMLDAFGNPWDDIYGDRWKVYNEYGDIEASFSEEQDALDYMDKNAGDESWRVEEDYFLETIDEYVRRNREAGLNDGVYVENIVDGANNMQETNLWIAFDPNQIKSATDNIGTFSKENNDIRYHFIGEKGAEALDKEKIQTLINQQRTNLADVDYLDLDSVAKILQNFENPIEIRENSAKISENDRAYAVADVQETALEKRQQQAKIKLIDTLLENSGVEYEVLSSEDLLKEAEKHDNAVTQVLTTNKGVLYGFVAGGKLYLNDNLAGVETRIHEYTHLWDESCKKKIYIYIPLDMGMMMSVSSYRFNL
ncbi:MAG: hypothetical protein IJ681_05570, partial [Bacteroidales bacterium]|nr:hypothetical protein [Bacteroidales bacterium]